MTSTKPQRRSKAAPLSRQPAVAVKADTTSPTASTSKLDRIVALLRRPEGATLSELQAVTGWQAHSVRGALAGAIKKRLATPVTSSKEERGRVYRTGEKGGA